MDKQETVRTDRNSMRLSPSPSLQLFRAECPVGKTAAFVLRSKNTPGPGVRETERGNMSQTERAGSCFCPTSKGKRRDTIACESYKKSQALNQPSVCEKYMEADSLKK